MNNISADATRVTAPPSLHWACDSPALPLLAVVPPSRIEPFSFSVVYIMPVKSNPPRLLPENEIQEDQTHDHPR